MNRRRVVAVAVLLCAAARAGQAQSGVSGPRPDLSAFDRYVPQAARDWRVPGLAIAMAVFSIATAPGLVAALFVGLRIGGLARRLSPACQGALWCALGLFVAVRPLVDHIQGCCH